MPSKFWNKKSRSNSPAPNLQLPTDNNQRSSQEPPQGSSTGRWSLRNLMKGSKSKKSASNATITPPAPTPSTTAMADHDSSGHGNPTVATGAGYSLVDSTQNTQNTDICEPQLQNVAPSTSAQEEPPLISIQASNDQVEQSLSTPSPAPAEPRSLWERALNMAHEELRTHGLPPLDENVLTSASAAENIQSIIATLQTAEQNDENALKRQRFRRVLLGVEKYTKIVDTAVQHSPEITSLVWAGVRAILMISINHLQAMECLEETMTTIAEKIAMCEFYAGIYAEVTTSKSLQGALDSALPNLYSGIIVFSVKAREYFHARWIRNILKPYDIEFVPFIEAITAREKVIREYADGATMERIKGMENHIKNIKSEIHEITTKTTETLEMAKQIQTTVLDEKTYELLGMLSPLEPLKRHEDIRSIRLQDTGTWLLQLPSFCNWRKGGIAVEQTERVFCCYGIPGAGKTVISSVVVDDLKSQLLRPSKVGVSCLYSDYRDQGAQTLVHILGSLLRQFLSIGFLSIPQEILEVLEEKRKQGSKLGKDDLLGLLKTTLQHLECAFICIDALDELEPKTRSQLLQAIKDLSTTSNSSLRVFLTGRKHIQSEIQKILNNSELLHEVEIAAHPDDIRKYLKREIADDLNSDAMDEVLENEVVASLLEQSQKMFLLPILHIKIILSMTTKSKRRKALQTLPSGLYETFGAVMARIEKLPGSQGDLGIRVLMWLHVAYRHFKLPELQHALSVETGQTKFDADNIPTLKMILECCLGLVILDEETGTVRFVHFTLEEFFRVHSNDYFPQGSSTAAEICLTYLNFADVLPHCSSKWDLTTRLRNFAFLDYAAINWGSYVAKQCNDIVKKLALDLLEQNGSTSCPLQVLYPCLPQDTSGASYEYILGLSAFGEIASKLSLVHVAAYFGLFEVIQCLCSTVPVDMSDDMGRTPLSWAAGGGHEAVVRLLLTRDDVDINAKDDDGRTPLSWAARGGYEAVVQLLLTRDDVDINAKGDAYGQTPLSLAAGGGHEAVVRLLLTRDDVDIDAKGNNGRTVADLARDRGYGHIADLISSKAVTEVKPSLS